MDKDAGHHRPRWTLGTLTHARDADVLIVRALVRLGRTVRDTLNMVHELKERGVGPYWPCSGRWNQPDSSKCNINSSSHSSQQKPGQARHHSNPINEAIAETPRAYSLGRSAPALPRPTFRTWCQARKSSSLGSDQTHRGHACIALP
ncbi:recombinase family protein [Arthrobacter oryzae]|uniref:recombinase family protein n=1 Tax=Arthrobacter oryzae TaxID=409290 RepID=UPI0037C0C64F